jgi:GNAT superfamily N-acetyltransferase
MTIRIGSEQDIPAVVALLKISLGVSLMQKTEHYWHWKHVANPFGTSPVLLAFEGSELVGVRAFMRWTWIEHGRVRHAVRAVDTATHPAYQGKGIFKQLTMGLVHQCRDEQVEFVFNTPNSQSKPGYLKMGWKEVGRFPVRIYLRSPLSMIKNGITKYREVHLPANESVTTCLEHPGFGKLLDVHNKSERMVTHHTTDTLRWRYDQVPVANYYACTLTDKKNELLGAAFFRFKASRFGLEMRVTDIFLTDVQHRKRLGEVLFEQASKYRADYITVSGLKSSVSFGGVFSFSVKRSGPTVTYRNVGDTVALEGFNNWSTSLGDLELF